LTLTAVVEVTGFACLGLDEIVSFTTTVNEPSWHVLYRLRRPS
jgi:hypothetical protein